VEFSQGNLIKETGKQFNIHYSTVEKWRKKANMESKHAVKQYSDKFKSEVSEFSTRNSLKETARKFNINKNTIEKWRKEANMESQLSGIQYSEKSKENSLENDFSHPLNPPAKTYQEGVHMLLDISNVPRGVLLLDEEVEGENVGFEQESIGFRARRMGKRLLNSFGNEGSCLKNNSVNCVVNVTSRKFATSKSSSEKKWNKKNKNELVQKLAEDFYKTQSWNESCNKFDVPVGSRRYWRRKLFGWEDNQMKGVSAESKTVGEIENSNIERKDSCMSFELDDTPHCTVTNSKCSACGYTLAFGETLDEHLVSLHLTTEGLCDICGEDPADFIDHFKKHLGLQPRILHNLKEEIDIADDYSEQIGEKEQKISLM